ncbi:hypothetical protein G6O69_33480 [Pseudenhygromyxa sp. WMMC2535]|uniref:hypothetical protein n=1 Tax=Pseudenhygromyxa sp. WMMC2535 TaxID=2712867 RepID=UPI001595A22E|nr:hypothetical protein [Pseudenhygromyxa sp. WMMC2535]NVB42782.1 hypothetical protein [Pseudenhygromyxa sp. WMMC2535]
MRRFIMFAFALLSLGGCAERQLAGPDSELLPVCMLYPAKGYDEHGDPTLLRDLDGSTGRTCDCLTQEELDEDLRLDEFHEQALEECLSLGAAFQTNDCQEMYDEGGWLLLMLPATGDNAWLTSGKGLSCAESTNEAGCAMNNTPSSPWSMFVLTAICLGLPTRRLRAP